MTKKFAVFVEGLTEQEFTIRLLTELAGRHGITGEDGQVFMLTPIAAKKSPLDVEGVALDLTADEIVDFIHEGRK